MAAIGKYPAVTYVFPGGGASPASRIPAVSTPASATARRPHPLGAGRGEEDAFASPVAIAAGPHGKVIVAGSAQFVAALKRHRPARDTFAIAVYECDGGGLDPHFGHAGTVLIPPLG